MISWHHSGNWLIVGVEETTHDYMRMPSSWKRGLLQSGIWLNMWIATPAGDRWYRITDFNKRNGPSDGYVGTSFTPDGKQAVWAEIANGNIFANHFGVWKLYIAAFSAGAGGDPSLVNKRDITLAGASWVEPGNFAPDGRHILISSDIGMRDAQGQSNASHLQQITHFSEPGYPESQPKRTVAAAAGFVPDGSRLFATVMSTNNSFTKTNWIVAFEGRCGLARGADSRSGKLTIP